MANIKSAKKRVLVNQKKAERNKSIKSGVKTSIRKVEAAVAAKDKEAAVAALQNAISTMIKQLQKVFITKILLQEKFPAYLKQ